MTIIIPARALAVEQEVKELDEKITRVCDNLKYAKSENIDNLVEGLKMLRNQADIARAELGELLRQAFKK